MGVVKADPFAGRRRRRARVVRGSAALAVLLLLFSVLAAACKPAVRPDPAPLARGCCSTPTDAVEASLAGGWISVRVEIPREADGPVPVVVSPIVPDEELLARGFAVARFHTNWEILRPFAADPSAAAPGAPPPQAGAGQEHVGAWLLSAPRPEIVGQAYFGLISNEAERSLPRVLDHLTSLPRIDPERIALTGSSTSGFVALQAMAHDPRIAVGVVRVACGDYHTFLRSSSLALNDDPRWLPGGKLVLDPAYALEIAAREPIRHADRYPPRPLLLLAGARDRAIPFACVANTVARFEAAYAEAGVPERFRFVDFPEQGHNLAGADQEVLSWLERWLGGAEPRDDFSR